MLSISAACSAEKNPSLPGCPDWATCCACSCAASMPGQLDASHAELKPVAELARNDLREAPCFFGVRLIMVPRTNFIIRKSRCQIHRESWDATSHAVASAIGAHCRVVVYRCSSTRVLMDLAHGRASLNVRSDIDAIEFG